MSPERPPSSPSPEAPHAVGRDTRSAAVRQSRQNWSTPGTVIAAAVANRPEVRFVTESFDEDRCRIVVVLDDDPEDLLDLVIETEREVHRDFAGLPFDVRITKPPKDWDEGPLRGSSILRHHRRSG